LQWRCFMAADHALANFDYPLTEAQLLRFTAVNIEDSARSLTKRVAWRLPGQIEIIVPDMETKLAAHLAGVGIGFLPK
ncbi:HTH-type transcriptional activator AllS, partial [Escherichia coli]